MLLKDIKAAFPTANVLTHDDLDGYVSGAIATKCLQLLGYKKQEIRVWHQSPSEPFQMNPGFTIITDLSCSSCNNYTKIMYMAKNSDNLVIWTDHHLNSVEMCKEMPDLKRVYGIRNTSGCGSMLIFVLYQILYMYKKMNRYDSITLKNIFEDNKALHNFFYNDGDWPFHNSPWLIPDYVNLLNYNTIPYPLLLTNAWDIHLTRVPEFEKASLYNVAFFHSTEFEKDVFSDYLQKYIVPESYEELLKAESITEKYITNGAKITRYQRYFYLDQLLQKGFLGRFDIPGYEDVWMICTNQKSMNFQTAFWTFETEYCPYDYAFTWVFSGNKYEITVYKRNAKPYEDKTAKGFCTRLGGGGHPGCAGAHVDVFPILLDVKPFPDDFRKRIKEEIDTLFI